MGRIDGAYSLLIMSPQKMIACRDPYGFRPLCYGKREDGTYIVASETCALDAVGAEYIRDLEPGEILVFSKDGIRSIRDHCGEKEHKICIFEYLYFARPDSQIEGKSVHEARRKAGALLAMQYPVDADIVIGVPDSGLDAAIGYAEQSGIPYGMGFVKNKYIGRTFIAPGQKNREDKVRIKLNVIRNSVAGKRVVLVDDSVVRGKPPSPESSSWFAPPAPRKFTSCPPHRPLPMPATTAWMWTPRKTSSPASAATIRTRLPGKSVPTAWATWT